MSANLTSPRLLAGKERAERTTALEGSDLHQPANWVIAVEPEVLQALKPIDDQGVLCRISELTNRREV